MNISFSKEGYVLNNGPHELSEDGHLTVALSAIDRVANNSIMPLDVVKQYLDENHDKSFYGECKSDSPDAINMATDPERLCIVSLDHVSHEISKIAIVTCTVNLEGKDELIKFVCARVKPTGILANQLRYKIDNNKPINFHYRAKALLFKDNRKQLTDIITWDLNS